MKNLKMKNLFTIENIPWAFNWRGINIEIVFDNSFRWGNFRNQKGEEKLAIDIKVNLKCHNMLAESLVNFDIIVRCIKMSTNYSNRKNRNVKGK
jgi:hypothetical protein